MIDFHVVLDLVLVTGVKQSQLLVWPCPRSLTILAAMPFMQASVKLT